MKKRNYLREPAEPCLSLFRIAIEKNPLFDIKFQDPCFGFYNTTPLFTHKGRARERDKGKGRTNERRESRTSTNITRLNIEQLWGLCGGRPQALPRLAGCGLNACKCGEHVMQLWRACHAGVACTYVWRNCAFSYVW